MSEKTSPLAGALIGAVAGLVMGIPIAYVVGVRLAAPTVKNFKLAPGVVAAVDVQAGQTITMEHISQRSFPVRAGFDVWVRPDEASEIVNRMVLVDVQAGEPIRRWMYGPLNCAEELRRAAGPHSSDKSVETLISRLRSR